jgi:hypothetical protein
MSFVFFEKENLFFQMFGLVLLMSGCQRQQASFLRIKNLEEMIVESYKERKKKERKKERKKGRMLAVENKLIFKDHLCCLS